jgi:hypothetical protein
MIKVILFIFLFLFQFNSEIKAEKVAQIIAGGEIFSTDNLGFVYVVENDVLTKYSPLGEKINSYKNSRFGSIYSIDSNNPLQTLVYYKDFNSIILLDNTLSQIGETISLDKLSFDGAELVCSASNGGFWIYNATTANLNYFNQNLKLIHKGIDIRKFSKSSEMPVFMIERNNSIYLNFGKNEIFVFDLFGMFKEKININVEKYFQVFDSNIYYYQNNKLNVFITKFQKTEIIEIPQIDNILSVRVESNYLFLKLKEIISVYKR